jgi:cation diffusion facilitator CzcD-associated flavoprotein CzcO
MADLVEGATGLEAAERIARHDLIRLNYPPANWVPERFGPDGQRVLDVLVVGAGMCGQTAGWNLLREGIRNIRVIERNAHRREGPWNTTARMPILRSPKHLTGPDLGVPSLTFRAWYEAQHGSAGWDALYKVKRLDWLDYLLWVRKVVDLPVENGVALDRIEPADRFLKATLSTGESLHVRKLVLANGRDGSGGFKWPRFPSFDPDSPKRIGKVFHTLEEIDFGKFAGKRIGVLGVLATAIDNTATALEAGAREAICYARRTHLPQVNKSKGASFPGFQRGQGMLDDEWRWKIYTYMLSAGSPPPHESVLRVQKLPGFSFRFAEPWFDVIIDEGGVTVKTARSTERFDVVMMGTGFDVDLSRRPELAPFANNIKTWGDTRSPEDAKANAEAALYPYLGAGFELIEKEPGRTPLLSDVHLFNWGSILSQGALAGDIPGLFVGSPRLTQAISHSLFRADVAQHAENMFNQEDPELAPTDYFVPREKRSGTL